MAIFKGSYDLPFATVPNETAQNKALSFEARGVLTLLLSMPSDWKVNKAWIIDQSSAGKDKVARILNELITHGYMIRQQTNNSVTGRFDEVDYAVFPVPQDKTDGTDDGKPASGKPDDGKPAPTNKQLNKETVNKDLKNTKSLDFEVLGLCESLIKEFKELRKLAKAPITQRVINTHAKEFEKSRKAGYSFDQMFDVWANKGWKAYKHEWFVNTVNSTAKYQGNQFNDQPSNQPPQIHGVAYGEFADQSVFPEHLRIQSNDMPHIKRSMAAFQKEFIESQSLEAMANPVNDVWNPVEFDEWGSAEHGMGEIPYLTDGEAGE